LKRKVGLLAAVVAALSLVAGMTLASAASTTPATSGWRWNPSGAAVKLSADVEPEGHTDGQTLVITTRPTHDKVINVDGREIGPGDYSVFRDRLFNRRGEPIGYTNAMCWVHFPFNRNTVTNFCQGTFILDGKGTIQVEGTLQFYADRPPLADLAVIGGTGHWQNVRGELHLTETAFVFHLIP